LQNNEPPSFQIPEPPSINQPEDTRAESEAAALAYDLDLKSRETASKLKRLGNKDRVDGAVAWILWLLIWTAGLLGIISFVVLFFHYLAPACWLFLDKDRVVSLQNFLFSGSFGAGLVALWKYQAGREEKSD
jgi:hypothetical protein